MKILAVKKNFWYFCPLFSKTPSLFVLNSCVAFLCRKRFIWNVLYIMYIVCTFTILYNFHVLIHASSNSVLNFWLSRMFDVYWNYIDIYPFPFMKKKNFFFKVFLCIFRKAILHANIFLMFANLMILTCLVKFFLYSYSSHQVSSPKVDFTCLLNSCAKFLQIFGSHCSFFF